MSITSTLATFVNFSKAFHSVDRNPLFKILRYYRISPKITDAITAMYTNSSGQVCLDNDFNKIFSITTGGLQGDILANFLFIIVVDYIFQQTDSSCGLNTRAENPEEILPDLDFAYNIVLLDETDTAA